MSGYENVVGGKLKLKGKALNVKDGGGINKKKKKKKHKNPDPEISQGHSTEELAAPSGDGVNESGKVSEEGKEAAAAAFDDYMTPAERRYMEQRDQIDIHKMAKEANKSHRDRIQDFNQYLANMSEHYDIPKVGPG